MSFSFTCKLAFQIIYRENKIVWSYIELLDPKDRIVRICMILRIDGQKWVLSCWYYKWSFVILSLGQDFWLWHWCHDFLPLIPFFIFIVLLCQWVGFLAWVVNKGSMIYARQGCQRLLGHITANSWPFLRSKQRNFRLSALVGIPTTVILLLFSCALFFLRDANYLLKSICDN